LNPLDKDTIIQSVIKTGRALIVHEAAKTGGFGGELGMAIVESEAFGYLDAPIVRLGGRDMPIPYNRTLEYHTVPQVENIVEKARDLVKMRI
jgi:pyruvate dehydrogenase E1 component beta subunit